jgi:hypothetical protein
VVSRRLSVDLAPVTRTDARHADGHRA